MLSCYATRPLVGVPLRRSSVHVAVKRSSLIYRAAISLELNSFHRPIEAGV